VNSTSDPSGEPHGSSRTGGHKDIARSRSGRRSSGTNVPRVRFGFEVVISCELLEGDVEDLAAIAEQFAAFLERRDDHIGLLAARDWALLADSVRVRALTVAEDAVVDVRGLKEPRAAP